MVDALIRPLYDGQDKAVSESVVMAATLTDLLYFADRTGLQRNDYRDFFSARLYRKLEKDHGFFLAGPFIGSPHAVILLENLIARGVKKILFIGWCGTLESDPDIGDIVMASGAYCDEGTSKHYGVTGTSAYLETSEKINSLLLKAMNDSCIPVKKADVWTTDALYRETPEKISMFRNLGASVVEMELSALLAVSAWRNVELSCCLVVSDDVSGASWRPGFRDKSFKTGRKKLADLVAAFVGAAGAIKS